MTTATVINQHLIDPEICIRCNTCESVCPIQAISHDANNYVVDAAICNHCQACVSPCPTGAIDNWHPVITPYSLEEQLSWEVLPARSDLPAEAEAQQEGAQWSGISTSGEASASLARLSASLARLSASVAPWSAAHPYVQLYGPRARFKSISATVTGNVRVTAVGTHYDTHHLVLDFGAMPFPLLEGQSIGIVPPGLDERGQRHHPRQYSVASPRNGERAGYNNLSLTIKRVLENHEGQSVHGIASNYLCDAKVGDEVEVIGPFGTSFLMPNHPGSHIVMICTGTGSAPMRAMTEWRRRLSRSGKANTGRLLLFFGARTPQELPYFGPLQNLPSDFIETHFAFSRVQGQAKVYVQDLMRQQAASLAALLADDNSYFYVCGLKAMEAGVLSALADISTAAGHSWPECAAQLIDHGRLHLETY